MVSTDGGRAREGPQPVRPAGGWCGRWFPARTGRVWPDGPTVGRIARTLNFLPVGPTHVVLWGLPGPLGRAGGMDGSSGRSGSGQVRPTVLGTACGCCCKSQYAICFRRNGWLADSRCWGGFRQWMALLAIVLTTIMPSRAPRWCRHSTVAPDSRTVDPMHKNMTEEPCEPVAPTRCAE